MTFRSPPLTSSRRRAVAAALWLLAAASPARASTGTVAGIPLAVPATASLAISSASAEARAAGGRAQAYRAPDPAVVYLDFSRARVRPNPWRADRHAGKKLVFDGLPPDSTVRIFTVSAHWVRTLEAPDGSAAWDLRNDAGAPVASGFYVYLATDGRKDKKRGVIGVVR